MQQQFGAGTLCRGVQVKLFEFTIPLHLGFEESPDRLLQGGIFGAG